MPQKGPSSRSLSIFHTTSLLLAGTFTVVITKVLFQTKAYNISGAQQEFSRPYFMTGFMFIGQLLCLLCYFPTWASQRKQRANECSEKKNLIDQADSNSKADAKSGSPAQSTLWHDITAGKSAWRLLGVTFAMVLLNLTGSTILSNALVLCDASIVQILRGVSIVFTMLLRFLYLKQKPARWQVLGVVTVIVGLVLVGVSAIISHELKSNSALEIGIGIGMVLLSQFFSANLYVLSERFMKRDGYHPLVLAGVQGIIGGALVFGVVCPIVNVIPGSDNGSVENYSNTIYMMTHNVIVTALIPVYILVAMFMNWSAMAITVMQSSLHGALLANVRIISIWMVMVVLYYATSGVVGEPVNLYTILEVAGFVLVFLGTLIHNNLWDLGHKTTCYRKHESDIESSREKHESVIESPKEIHESDKNDLRRSSVVKCKEPDSNRDSLS